MDHHLARHLAHARREVFPNFDFPTPVATPDISRIFARQAESATSTCTDTTSPGCEPSGGGLGSNTGAIIGISVALPLTAAFIALFILHRRVKRKQAAEDARDAQDDLDFGIDPKYKNMGPAKKGRAKRRGADPNGGGEWGPEKELRRGGHNVGMSIDLGNPYMLPADMHGSRDSLHSLTRSLTDSQDPYRIVGQKAPSVRGFNDASSTRSGSDRGLLANQSPMPMSRGQSPLVPHDASSTIQRKEVAPSTLKSASSSEPSSDDTVVAMPTFDFTDHSATDKPSDRVSGHLSGPLSGHLSGHLSQKSHGSQKSVHAALANRLSDPNKSLPDTPQDLTTPPPRGASLTEPTSYGHNNNAGPVDPYAFQEIVVPPSPERSAHYGYDEPAQEDRSHPDAQSFAHPPPPEPQNDGLGLGLDLAGNRLSVLRPLPPDDPNDTAESRANRIRSFYKEYFADDSAHVHDAQGAHYYEDYGDEFLGDGAVFDPETGQFIVAQRPYADPITRRAMTPPPRGPPQTFRSGPRRPGHSSQTSSPAIGGRSRAFSNASYSRAGPGFGPRGRPPGKRPLPPPSALKNLPTPSLLKEDMMLTSADFAPPSSYRERVQGRSDSPLLGERPYSPAVPVASPLTSAFTELAAVPSPHMLRKSGTFTGLDFAPPPRIKVDGGGSDAASIRSGRSNFSAMSARQQHNIRAGAYRLSRVPKELVGTKGDLMDSLKPQWKLGT